MGIFRNAEKENAKMNASNWLRIMQESANIVRSTVNPDTFFSRLDVLIATLGQLSDAEKYVKFNGIKPSALLRKTADDKQDMIRDFIERYYDDVRKKMASVSTCSAKLKKASAFIDTLNLYSAQMDAATIQRANALHSALVHQAETAPGQKINLPE